MKQLKIFSVFAVVSLVSSLSDPCTSFAQDTHPFQSQSFFRLGENAMDPGMIQVILPKAVPEYHFWVAGNSEQQVESNALLMFDKRNPLPPTEFAGSNYLFTRGGYFATITADGFLNYKGRVAFRPAVLGGVWFIIEGTRELYAVDSYGYYVSTGIRVDTVKVAGGNYLIDGNDTLITIKSMGQVPGSPVGLATLKTGWSFPGVQVAGGSFFVKSDGTLVTVDSTNGFFNELVPGARPAIVGGNYFVGEDRVLYTVTCEGRLIQNPSVVVRSQPILTGYSALKLEDGLVVAVDSDGVPHGTLVRVSTTGVRVKVVRTLDVDVDLGSIFAPKVLK